MSLFGTKKKVYVSSTVYKMIDDGNDRPTFMRELLAGSALSRNGSFAEAIQAGIAKGPRSRQQNFFRWAKTNFDIGMPRAALNYTETINDAAVAAQILATEHAGNTAYTINVLNSFIDNADESYYAERWIYANYPEKAHLDWAADADPVTNDIYIQWPDNTSNVINIPGLNSSTTVLVAYYTVTHAGNTGTVKVFIYVMGSGNTLLDNRNIQISSGSGVREFYPFIPLRINNVSVFATGSPAKPHEALIRKAWKKALGTEIDEAITQLNTNAQISEIDYAYLVLGVTLNTEDAAEKAYLYEFFKLLAERQALPGSAFSDWANTNNVFGFHSRFDGDNATVNVDAVNNATNNGRLDGVDPASYVTAPQVESVHLNLPSADLGVLDMKITWAGITENTYSGVAEHGARKGDVIIRSGYRIDNSLRVMLHTGQTVFVNSATGISIKKQISLNEYSEIRVDGLLHKNLIYKNKEVTTSAEDALKDPDPSEFIIPLHEPTLKRLGGIKASEVARESYLMVFNSYKVVKKKWYQTGFFKFLLAIILVVVVVVITVLTYGTGSPQAIAATSGILGSAATVGAALGFTGLMAIAVGAAANAIAAMLVLQIVNVAGTAVFGEKIGKILTAVAAVIMVLGTGPGGFSFENVANSVNWANMAAIDKLSLITNAATDIIRTFQEASLEGILAKTKDALEDYKSEMNRLEDLMKEFQNDGILDPKMLTDFTSPLNKWSQMGSDWARGGFFGETPQGFLDRTLLSGGELIELSHSMISDFVDAALTLP